MEQEATTTPAAPVTPQPWVFEPHTVEALIYWFVCLILELGIDDIALAHQAARWEVGTDLATHTDALCRRLGVIYMCDALARTPEAQLYLFNRIREALLLIGRGTGIEQVTPPLDAAYSRYVRGMPTPREADEQGTE